MRLPRPHLNFLLLTLLLWTQARLTQLTKNCPPGWFLNREKVCQECLPSCELCTALDRCTKCAEGFNIDDQSINGKAFCMQECSYVYGRQSYFSQLELTCKLCEPPCETCFDLADPGGPVCLSCQSTHFLWTKTNLTQYGSCLKSGCHESCGTCRGPNRNDCLTCRNPVPGRD